MARVIASPKCALEFHTRIAVKEIIVVIKVSVTECCLLLNVVCPSILDSDELITRFLCCFYFFICSVANTKFCFFLLRNLLTSMVENFVPLFLFYLRQNTKCMAYSVLLQLSCYSTV